MHYLVSLLFKNKYIKCSPELFHRLMPSARIRFQHKFQGVNYLQDSHGLAAAQSPGSVISFS